MKIVLDTNVLLVALPSHSPFHIIFTALQQGRYNMYVSNEVLTEYEEKISERLGINRTDLQLRELLNYPNVHLTDIFYRWHFIVADPDDDKFVDCAVSSNADFIVTNDNHYKVLKQVDFPKIPTIKAEEFVELLKNKAHENS